MKNPIRFLLLAPLLPHTAGPSRLSSPGFASPMSRHLPVLVLVLVLVFRQAPEASSPSFEHAKTLQPMDLSFSHHHLHPYPHQAYPFASPSRAALLLHEAQPMRELHRRVSRRAFPKSRPVERDSGAAASPPVAVLPKRIWGREDGIDM